MSDTVECAVCSHRAHILIPHLRDEHGLTAKAYLEQHPKQALWSMMGNRILQEYLRDAQDKGQVEAKSRPSREMKISELFAEHKKFQDAGFVCNVFEPAPWVPQGSDEGYVYDLMATSTLIYAFNRSRRNAAWIGGPAGTGKTQLVHHVCRKLNRELVRVTMDSSITRADLVGDWTVQDGQTKFSYGIIPQAMRRGAVLLLDEYDMANPYVIPLFRPLLEDNPRLIVLENAGEVIEPHPDFRIVATANTFGNGDATGHYSTTQTLSLADRQRFSVFIEMHFLPISDEINMLTEAVADLEHEGASQIVTVANAMRREFRRGTLEESMSPRQMVNFAETYVDFGDIVQAAKATFLRPLTEASQLAVLNLLREAGFQVTHEDEETEES